VELRRTEPGSPLSSQGFRWARPLLVVVVTSCSGKTEIGAVNPFAEAGARPAGEATPLNLGALELHLFERRAISAVTLGQAYDQDQELLGQLEDGASWSIDDASIAALERSPAGTFVRANQAGITTLRGTLNGQVGATTPVTVFPAALTSLALEPSDIALPPATYVSLTGAYADGFRSDSLGTVWSIADPEVVTIGDGVSARTLLTPLANGETVLSARVGSLTIAANVHASR
jgi:hypothetical protein